MRRPGLAWRIGVLGVGVAVLTAALAGILTAGLLRNDGTATARRDLARLADVAQTLVSQTPRARRTEGRLRALFADLDVRSGAISRSGALNTRAPLVRRLLTPADLDEVLAGRSLSFERSVSGDVAFLEARPTSAGGIVLVQRRADALAAGRQAVRRALIALLVAAAIAVALAALVAWRIARPLRRTAAAAHALAEGDREVEVPVEGPPEVIEVAEAITTLAGALRTSEARQRDFLMSVSHDLRTPLTAIRGYAESLAEGAVESADVVRVGAVMNSEAHRMEVLVGDLLDLARLGADDFRITFATLDLRTVVEEAGEVYRARCLREGIRFEVEMPAAPVVVSSDAQRVRQALDGLFDNALRVTPEGASIVLALRREPGGEAAIIEVRDSGPGLSDDDLAVAFTRGTLHQRYAGVRRVGSGLGLAIVHGLITRLGGSAEAGHAPEGGACFALRLPFAPVVP